jgi:polysaccharide export outer membrane protein
MKNRASLLGRAWIAGCLVLIVMQTGCQHTRVMENQVLGTNLPNEVNKRVLPDYVIEPPDILLVDAVSIIPKPPYRVAPGDVLLVQVGNAFETEPIAGPFAIEPEGTINLGASYGTVQVANLTIPEVRDEIIRHLSSIIKEPRVYVALGQSRAMQQIRGQHLVTPDGKVRLGLYGSVIVAGMTVQEARRAIENHLSAYLQNPEISVDVLAYNSKVYYVIMDGGGNGQQVVRLPITGNDTVLDAISQLGGLTALSSTTKIWLARRNTAGADCDQILPVDWNGITTRGRVATNYQLMPGDRIYVAAKPLATLETGLARFTAPIERVLGTSLLGSATVRSFKFLGTGTGGGVFP